jgi:hypothetical protein
LNLVIFEILNWLYIEFLFLWQNRRRIHLLNFIYKWTFFFSTCFKNFWFFLWTIIVSRKPFPTVSHFDVFLSFNSSTKLIFNVIITEHIFFINLFNLHPWWYLIHLPICSFPMFITNHRIGGLLNINTFFIIRIKISIKYLFGRTT